MSSMVSRLTPGVRLCYHACEKMGSSGGIFSPELASESRRVESVSVIDGYGYCSSDGHVDVKSSRRMLSRMLDASLLLMEAMQS